MSDGDEDSIVIKKTIKILCTAAIMSWNDVMYECSDDVVSDKKRKNMFLSKELLFSKATRNEK